MSADKKQGGYNNKSVRDKKGKEFKFGKSVWTDIRRKQGLNRPQKKIISVNNGVISAAR